VRGSPGWETPFNCSDFITQKLLAASCSVGCRLPTFGRLANNLDASRIIAKPRNVIRNEWPFYFARELCLFPFRVSRAVGGSRTSGIRGI
jgi:hypothetical protein